MTKLVMIHTISTVRHAYAVRIDDDADIDKVAEEVIIENNMDEIYETFCNERFETWYDITEEDVINLFDNHHSVMSDWEPKRKLEIIIDRTKK